MAPLVLGYWTYRGLGAAIHYLLKHVGAEYVTEEYTFGPAPDFEREKWLKDKESGALGLAFPNVPYLIDGDLKLNQSLAIMRYLGSKYGLDGKTDRDKILLSMLEHEAYDLDMGLSAIAYSPFYEELKQGYLDNLPTKLEQFSKYLGDREWFVGDALTYVDFTIHEALDHNRFFAPQLFAKYPNLVAFLKRVQSLPQVKKYMESDKFVRWPIFAPKGKFGGSGPMPV